MERVAIAAVNGPGSVVVSGDSEALDELLAQCEAGAIRARRIAVDYAAHSAQVEVVREQLLAGCAPIAPRTGDIPFYSTVTAGLLDTAELDADYWYRNLRETVQFAQTTQMLVQAGRDTLVEISPHPVLTVGVQETIDLERAAERPGADAPGGEELARRGVAVLGTVRRDDGGPRRFMRSLAEAWVHGVSVEWGAMFGSAARPGARRVALPTYAFQRKHYWLLPSADAGDVGAAGLSAADHPLLGGVIGLADGGGWLFTGCLALDSHPWLADHAVLGSVLLPGTAFLELALHAGEQAGCAEVRELTLQEPLLLAQGRRVRVQVAVGELQESGCRTVGIYARPEGAADDGVDGEEAWVHHASGLLAPALSATAHPHRRELASLGAAWPPADATEVDVEDLYEHLREQGLEYGPAFRGLLGAWRRGDEVFAEVALPQDEQRGEADSFGLHPALLDASLHALAVGVSGEGREAYRPAQMPFSWSGVRLHAACASALRVRMERVGEDAFAVTAADGDGALVATADSLALREVPAEGFGGASDPRRDALLALEWAAADLDAGVGEGAAGEEEGERGWAVVSPLPGGGGALADGLRGCGVGGPGGSLLGVFAKLGEVAGGEGLDVVVFDCTSGGLADGGNGVPGAEREGVPGAVRDEVCRALELVQEWLSQDRFTSARLVVVTRGAVEVGREGVIDLAGAAVWGLLRSAQAEHPGRFTLVDVDGEDGCWAAVVGAATAEDRSEIAQQVAVRGGGLLVPRLGRPPAAAGVQMGTHTEAEMDAGGAVAPDTRDGGDPPAEPDVAEGGTVLVTGGTGGLGALVARHLVARRGARDLVLASRRGPGADGVGELESELVAMGAQVRVRACDVSDRGEVQALIAEIGDSLRTIVHAAGVLDDGMVESLTAERVARMLAAKVDGAWYLHELTRDLNIREFVLFSSAAGVFGSAGQGGYAASNTFLDALACRRRAQGLPGVSVAWGLWAQSSDMTGNLRAADRARLERLGIVPLETDEGLELLDAARASPLALAVAIHLDLRAARAALDNGEMAGLLRGLIGARPRRARAGSGGSLRRQLEGLPQSERLPAVLELVRAQAAAVLGHPSAELVEAERAFKELGFDSLGAVELRNRLEAASGLRLPATSVFDHPSPAALAAHLAGLIEEEGPGSSASGRLRHPLGSGVGRNVGARRTRAVEEPIAIVGMSCRYPGGVSSPRELWELVAGGRDGIAWFPEDRGWDVEGLYDPDPDGGGSCAREGGFVDGAGEFDASLFGISPREALAMDPQQRLFLESSWEALEDAGLNPLGLRGSSTGVFAGVMYHEYGNGLSGQALAGLEGYMGTGGAGSVVSGRVAYALGLEGPAMSVDTACSSSLVALHSACQALRLGECELALAGGVTVLWTPAVFVDFTRQRALAPNGRCKPYAEAADGANFGEGVGVLVLEPLSRALANGRRVLAVVRGSAVNQDGASNGLTSPNGPAQERVIAQALASAGVAAHEVDAVEGHGTGTKLGDPIEAQALLASYGRDRPRDAPLWLGSVKSNIGHTQAAAGVAGVIKMVKALEHGVLPSTLHVDQPSTHVDWDAGAVSLLTEEQPWLPNGRPRRAGVSSFGISGTNAHLILEEAPRGEPPAGEPAQKPPPGVLPWVLSGRGEESLRAQAARLGGLLAQAPELDVADVGLSLAGRATFEDRAVLLTESPPTRGREELLGGLGALAGGESAGSVLRGRAGRGRVAFLFTGQGAQRAGMGGELYREHPVFRAAFDEVCAHLDGQLGCSLREVVFGEPEPAGENDEAPAGEGGGAPAGESDGAQAGEGGGAPAGEGVAALDGTALAQPALFALEVALYRLVSAWGVRPDFLIGHSVGELAAAHVAGVFSLEDACRLVAARGRLMGALPAGGAMVAIAAGEDEVRESLAGLERSQERVALAAVNAPGSVVVSGDEDAVEELRSLWEARGARVKRLRVSHAFHSPRMDAMLEEFGRVAESVSFSEPRLPLASNLSGGMASGEELCTAAYWVRHVRETVRFADGVRWLRAEGVSSFLELGPDGVLSAMVEECVDGESDAGGDAPQVTVANVLRAGESEARALLTGLSEVWVRGVAVDWGAVFEESGARRVELPAYAFQRERYWLQPASGSASGGVSGVEGLRYRVWWKPVGESAAGELAGAWPVVVPAGCDAGLVEGVLGALSARGAEPVVVEVDEAGADRETLAERLRGVDAVGGVVSLLGLDGDGDRVLDGGGAGALGRGGVVGGEPGVLDGDGAIDGVAGVLALAQALGDAGVRAPLWCLTRGAVSVGAGDRLSSPTRGLIWGLGRVVGLEEPGRWGGLIDLPAEPDARTFERLCGVLAESAGEDELALRAEGVFVRRLVRAPLGKRRAKQQYTPRGTVLVTGGTGALGGHVARWLVGAGAEHLLLSSRRGADAPGVAELVSELERDGAEVGVVACDIADRGQLQELLAEIPAERPLSGVFHAAGVAEEIELDRLSAEELEARLAGKARGALLLHELTAGLELDAFVLFSSIAGVLGSGRQAAYSAGNAFLDALAEHRRDSGMPATSLAWGAWAGGGMASGAAERLGRLGLREMPVDLALDVLQGALERGDRPLVVADIDWERYALTYTSARARPSIGELAEVRQVLDRAAGELERVAGAGLLAERLAELSAGERRRIVLDLVREHVAAVLGHSSSQDVRTELAFREMGFDSLAGVQLARGLSAATGVRLAATAVFDHPTPVELAEHLLAEATGATALAGPALPALRAVDEPLAIVGIGCRYPGPAHPAGTGSVRSAEDLWELLAAGGDAIGAFPADRGWDLEGLYDPNPEHEGTSYAREGGFLYDAGEFDASFFGIGPREALAMDPQQRLLLEVCWEALEDAGVDPLSLRGSATGVFAGVGSSGYGLGAPPTQSGGESVEGYRMTGGLASVVSGRVAYTFGLEGPAVSVDTACSSALVALHLAAGALRAGECSLALAGGVAVMASPEAFVEFSRQRGLAPDGRCKSFGAGADGTGWSEGVGVLLLERLSDAERNGHRVLALLRGSAVNQDGASNGLTAPSGPAQQRVILQALASAGLSPAEVDAVEAHGTGTTLGDPIEAQALLATYGQSRPPDAPLWLGSVKSNIGHAAAAAGVAGVIKMVMALRHGLLPRTLHAEQPSTQVDWDAGAVALLTEEQPWRPGGRPRRAGVSSFGVSGTNAHVILEEAPAPVALSAASEALEQGAPGVDAPVVVAPVVVAESDAFSAGVVPWALSGRGGEGLRAQAEKLRGFLASRPELDVLDVGFSLGGRSALEDRAVLLGESREELLAGLGALAGGEARGGVLRGGTGGGRVAFLFTGQGAQRVGMGRELYEAFPVFRAAFDEVCAQLDPHLECSLREVVFGETQPAGENGGAPSGEDGGARAGEGVAALDGTALAQPALFALEVALYRLVSAWGVRPDFLIGHSVGELAAAHVAGVFSLEDACRLVVARGRLMGALPGGGAMVAIGVSEAEVLESLAALDGWEGRVALAAVNAPGSVVVSGDEDAVAELVGVWEARGARVKRLRVSHAFHSPRMDAMLEEFGRVAEGVSFGEPRIPLVSNLTGALASGGELCTAMYWVRHVRETVRFADGVRWLVGEGVGSFLELGPDGVLSAMVEECVDGVQIADGVPSAGEGEELTSGPEQLAVAVPVLRARQAEAHSLLAGLGAMWVHGARVGWDAVCAGSGAQRVALPAYAFQREHYWLQSSGGAGDAGSVGQVVVEHPLLDAAVAPADGRGWLFTGRISLRTHRWLADRVVHGVAVLPETAFVELVLHAGGRLGCGCMRELSIETPLALGEDESVRIQLVVGEPDGSECRAVEIYSRVGVAALGEELAQAPWTRHAVGLLAPDDGEAIDRVAADELGGAWPVAGAMEIDLDGVYEGLAAVGLEYGPAFQGLRGAWRRGDEVFVEVALPEEREVEASLFGVHPALLDGALHAVGMSASGASAGARGGLRLPLSWGGVRLHAAGPSALRARLAPAGDEAVSMVVTDEWGEPVASVETLVLRAASSERLGGVAGGRRDALFGVEWAPVAVGGEGAESVSLVALGEIAGDESRVPEAVWVSCEGALEGLGETSGEGAGEGGGGASDDDEVVGIAHRATRSVLGVLQRWLAEERFADSRLVVVTEGAVAVGTEGVPGLACAAVWGLVRAAQAEHPGRFALVDVDGLEDSHAALTAAVACGEPQVAVRRGELFAPRLVRLAAQEDLAGERETSVGTALVTGGTGGLGALVARHLVERCGVRDLVLASRRGPSAEGAAELEAELVGLGARVRVAACDVSDRSALEGLLESIDGALDLVVHAAGALDDGVIESLTEQQVERVLAAKVDGAWHLHELTRDRGAPELVMFSSTAGVFGNAGQAGYAAGNAFLDALAGHRRESGLPGVSVAWGLWAAEGGMGGRLAAGDAARLERSGVGRLEVDEGLELFDRARGSSRALVVGARLDVRMFSAAVGDGEVSWLLRGLLGGRRRRVGVGVAGSLQRRLAGVAEGERLQVVLELVRAQTAAVLGHPSPERVGSERAFRELGVDSLAAVELRNRLGAASGLRLATTLVFDHPNPVALAQHLLGLLAGAGRSVRVARATRAEEPVAIVGMSCRYPGGVSSPQELWELVAEGRDGISGFPIDRGWDLEGLYDPDPDSPGRSYARDGGFVHGAGEFDASFFGIGPREALAMDPQQRLLLEVCWEALEDAGLDPFALRGSGTGVFAGVNYHEYASGLSARALEGLEGYVGTGSAGSVVSGRVAYALGLEGPAVSVDTACSSSLVALHWASQALRAGECELALAGGVTVLWTPAVFVEFSRLRGLARDGRCKSYADAADGTGWGEGVGVLVLERLSQARRNGHRVLGVVSGSAVNQDGASNGLTSPNGPSQERVIMQALANAGLTPGEVDAVEGHGTGTTLGDPIEAQALLATYGRERSQEQPLWLGSVKSNIGHTQAAAGVAGVIKMVKALEHGVLPRTLHVDRPSSHVDWGAGAVSLLQEEQSWQAGDRPRRAGVSSFGISGTNAHVILEEAPPWTLSTGEPAGRSVPGALPWVVSGRGAGGLAAQAARLRRFLAEQPELDCADVALSLANRPQLEERAVVLSESPYAQDRERLLEGLGALAGGESAAGVLCGSNRAGEGRVAFLFTGQGAQRVGMGRELYEAFGVFRVAFDEVCAQLDPHLGCSLREVVFGEGEPAGESGGAPAAADGNPLDGTALAQPGLFALEVALYRLVRAWGVRPDFLIGHSVGELAAAHVAGVFSLEDACRLVAARGRLMGALPGGGAMVAIAAPEEEVRASLAVLEGWEERVALAAVNAPGSVVVSGDEDAVEELRGVWEARGARVKRLRVSHAFHSPRMDGMLEEFGRVAEGVSFSEPRIPLVSNLSGAVASVEELCSAEYWVRHVRETVRFADGVRWLYGERVRSFLELGPDGVLSAMVDECVAGLGETGEAGGGAGGGEVGVGEDGVLAVAALRAGWGESRALLAGLGEAWVRGVGVDWGAVCEGSGARRVGLPSYAFQRERYWLEMGSGLGSGEVSAAVDGVDGEFWGAVEAGDVEGLAGMLGAGGEGEHASLEAVLPVLGGWRRGMVERSVVDRWRYRVRWKPLSDLGVGVLRGVWLVVVPMGREGELTDGVVGALGARGAQPVVVEVDAAGVDREGLAGRLRVADVVGGVVSLLALDEAGDGVPGSGGGVGGGVVGSLMLAQALGDAGVEAPLWCVTRSAVSVGAGDLLARPAGGLVWGLARVVGLEEPGRWGGLVDLPGEPDGRTFERLGGVLAGLEGEDEVAVRAGGVFARRLVRAPLGGRRAKGSYTPRGTVLVTGGTGAVGGHVARWLAGAGAEHILLASRRGPDASGAAELVRELAQLGASVSVAACDVADGDQLAGVLEEVPAECPLSAVFHAAAVLDDGLIDGLTFERLAGVLRAKADAAWLLHELTEGLELDAFVLFSSLAGTLGSGGQGAYAAGNAFLDALAEHRRGHGLTATSVAWGAWAGEGMAAGVAERLRRTGVRGMAPDKAVAALQRALDADDSHIVLADIEWERYAANLDITREHPLVGELPEARQALRARLDVESADVGRRSLAARLADVPEREREQVVLELVRSHVAGVLGHSSPESVQAEQVFKDLGLDSLSGVELRNRLAAASGLKLPAALVFDYPTPRALASYLLSEVAGTRVSVAASVTAARMDEPIAIVGMSCRYPGGVVSPGQLWELVAAGSDAIGWFPTDRGWDLDSLYDPEARRPGTSYVREGGFLLDAGEFDASFFGIGAREALAMNPQQRLLLEACWETFESAGVPPASLRGSQTGVFAGISISDYGIGPLGSETRDLEGYIGTGSAPSVVSGRVAYTFGLEGPAVTVDTACSSSLVALHLACQALRCGECSFALAGGVTVMASPIIFVEFSRQRALAQDGRCKSFADAADGTGFSEGAGVLLLERLSDARRNGHTVLAVVQGSAINQDGASNGLTAPNGPSQQRVIMQALANAGLSPEQVDAVEAHGTGTTLGDPIEAQALIATYGQERPRDRPLWLGSVKSNIGHTQAAAGVAGVIKMALALRHGVLPRTLHVDRPSERIDWSGGAVALLTEEVPWARNGRPRRAGVSSFGVSGTNAHVIVEEAPA